MRASAGRGLLALCAGVLCLALGPQPASATSTQAEIETAIEAGVEYGSARIDPVTGEPQDPVNFEYFDHTRFTTEAIAFGLAAAGVNAADVDAGGPSLQDFIAAEYGGGTGWWTGPPSFLSAEDWTRATLIAHAAGLDTSRVSAELNLPAQLAGIWNPGTGSFGNYKGQSGTIETAASVLALTTAPLPERVLGPVVAHLRDLQEPDGSWTEELRTPAEMTGMSIAALCGAGVPAYDPQLSAAVAFLHDGLVDATGAIEEANAESTANAVSGLNACGIDPQSPAWTTPAGKTPIDYLLSLQHASGPQEGGFAYEPGEPAYMFTTGDVLRAIAGSGFVVDPPAREDTSLPRVRPVDAPAGTPVGHLLAIEPAPGNMKTCKVTAAAGASLAKVLSAPKADYFPVGCIGSRAFSGGRLTLLNGKAPENADEAWLVQIDRGVEELAGRQTVGFGDTIALRLGPDPTPPPLLDGRQGAIGPSGGPGASGRRGPKGRPGRNAHISCRAKHRRHGSGPRARCAVRGGRAPAERVR